MESYRTVRYPIPYPIPYPVPYRTIHHTIHHTTPHHTIPYQLYQINCTLTLLWSLYMLANSFSHLCLLGLSLSFFLWQKNYLTTYGYFWNLFLAFLYLSHYTQNWCLYKLCTGLFFFFFFSKEHFIFNLW